LNFVSAENVVDARWSGPAFAGKRRAPNLITPRTFPVSGQQSHRQLGSRWFLVKYMDDVFQARKWHQTVPLTPKRVE
jgi:hypothetical protein